MTTDAPLVAGGAPTTVPVQAAPDLHDPVEAAGAALAAWGDFAGTGDLSRVRLTFVPDGPQARQLEQEAERIQRADGAGYRVALSDANVEVSDGIATVVGTVTWSRPDEAEQVYRWAIELHAAEGSWRLFTVRSVEG